MDPEALHDIVEPTAVSWMPSTVGWVIVGVVLLGMALRSGWLRYRRWQADAYRRAGLVELLSLRAAVLGTEGSPVGDGIGGSGEREALASLPALVKRVALAAADRGEVAAMTGDVWLAWLDGSYHRPAFTHGVGRLLPELAYAPGLAGRLDRTEIDQLLGLVEDWIRTHRVA
jgi:hypothetical protein